MPIPRHPNFRYYIAARFLSALASEMQALAVAWQIYGLTRRPLDLGLVGLAQFLPGILLFLLTGHTADRLPRQRILQACSAAFSAGSVLLLVLTLRGVTALSIYLAVLWNGVVRAFNGPAGQAFLPLLVSEEHFPAAVAWGASTFQGATILGPLAGGLVYGWTASPLAVYVMRRPRIPHRVRVVLGDPSPRGRTSGRGAFPGHGLRRLPLHLAQQVDPGRDFARSVRGAAGRRGGAAAGVCARDPEGGRDRPGHSARRSRRGRDSHGDRGGLVAPGAAGRENRCSSCVFGFGLFTIVFALSRNLALSVAALALIGACDMVSVVIRHTLVQLRTPDEMRGRVSAVNAVFIGASNEVGQFESGLTAQWFGAVPGGTAGGIGTIAVVVVWAWLFPVAPGG